MTDRGTHPHYGRRRFLAAGALVGLGTAIGIGVDDVVAAPGRGRGSRVRSTTEPTSMAASTLVSGRFHSDRRGVEVGWTVSRPPGWRVSDHVPVCLVLHGYAADHTYAFDALRLQDVQAALAEGEPARPLVLAAVDGGDGYWHPRADGNDPQGMLMEEFLPLVRQMGVAIDHVVAFGWSMGGYGALLLAEAYSNRIHRVGAESPAIWPSFAASQAANPSAFDSARDWARHDVVAGLPELAGTSVHIDCGLADPFLPASRRLGAILEAGDVELSPGGHDLSFWQSHAHEQLQFLAS